MVIRVLRPNVTRDDAIRELKPSRASRLMRMFAQRPLCAIFPFFLPFRLHVVRIEDRALRETRLLALDAVTGIFDMYGFDQPPAPGEMLQAETRNVADIQIDEPKSRQIVIDNVRRAAFQRGFFRVRELRINIRSACLSSTCLTG